MGWPRADEEDATEDLVAADETWIREVMEESGVGWPRVHEEGATTWPAQGLDLVGDSDLCIGWLAGTKRVKGGALRAQVRRIQKTYFHVLSSEALLPPCVGADCRL